MCACCCALAVARLVELDLKCVWFFVALLFCFRLQCLSLSPLVLPVFARITQNRRICCARTCMYELNTSTLSCGSGSITSAGLACVCFVVRKYTKSCCLRTVATSPVVLVVVVREQYNIAVSSRHPRANADRLRPAQSAASSATIERAVQKSLVRSKHLIHTSGVSRTAQRRCNCIVCDFVVCARV